MVESPEAPGSPAPDSETQPSNTTKAMYSSIHHWALYGQRQNQNPSSQHPNPPPLPPRTSPPSKARKMCTPVLSSWEIRLSESQVAKLRRGFSPKQMEDKWLIYSLDEGEEERDEEEEQKRKEVAKRREAAPMPHSMRVFMVRSWTGKPVYEILARIMRREARGEKGGEDEDEMEIEGRIESLTWESDESVVKGHDEAGNVAKERVGEVCRWILGVELGLGQKTGGDKTGEE